jgi:hypothetical protein
VKKEEETKVAAFFAQPTTAKQSTGGQVNKVPQEVTTDFGQTFKATYKMQLVASDACYNLVIDS